MAGSTDNSEMIGFNGRSVPEEFNAAGLIVPDPSFIPPMPFSGVEI